MGRVSRLNDTNFAKEVAALYVEGKTRREMADHFNVHVDTITDWTQDIRVKAHAAKMSQERVNRITRRIDATIEGRLQEADKLDTETLLKIRKEFRDQVVKMDVGNADKNADTIKDTMELMEALGLDKILAAAAPEPEPDGSSD